MREIVNQEQLKGILEAINSSKNGVVSGTAISRVVTDMMRLRRVCEKLINSDLSRDDIIEEIKGLLNG